MERLSNCCGAEIEQHEFINDDNRDELYYLCSKCGDTIDDPTTKDGQTIRNELEKVYARGHSAGLGLNLREKSVKAVMSDAERAIEAYCNERERLVKQKHLDDLSLLEPIAQDLPDSIWFPLAERFRSLKAELQSKEEAV